MGKGVAMADARKRFEKMDEQLAETREMVYTLWEYVEKQQRAIEALRKRVGGLSKRKSRHR